MDRTKQAKDVRPGDYLLKDGAWKRVTSAKPQITTIDINFEDGTDVQVGLELTVRYKIYAEVGEEERDKLIREGKATELARRSSQKGMGPEKIGASPSKKTSLVGWAVGAMFGIILSGGCISSAGDLGASPWLQLIIGVLTLIFVTWWVHAIVIQFAKGIAAQKQNEYLWNTLHHYRDEATDLRTEVKLLKRTSFSSEIGDFVHGFNTAGVEIALGGADPFGPMAEAALRFPATVLHKHLTNAMVEGWEAARASMGATPETLFGKEARATAEEMAWRWIQQMAEGKR